MRIVVKCGVGLAVLVVIDRVGVHPAIVLVGMAVVIHWTVSSNGSNRAVLRTMFAGSLVSYLLYVSLLDRFGVVPGEAASEEASLWALIGTITGWGGVGLGYACVMPVARRTAFWWRLRNGRSSNTDVRDIFVKHRHWGLEAGQFEQMTIREALKESRVEPATVGCWYYAGETPNRLAVALAAGINNEGLCAHANGTVSLDWGTVETLAALRRPL